MTRQIEIEALVMLSLSAAPTSCLCLSPVGLVYGHQFHQCCWAAFYFDSFASVGCQLDF